MVAEVVKAVVVALEVRAIQEQVMEVGHTL
jgi:hypothetical protein